MDPKVTTTIRYLFHFNNVQTGNLMDSKIAKFNHLSIEATYAVMNEPNLNMALPS